MSTHSDLASAHSDLCPTHSNLCPHSLWPLPPLTQPLGDDSPFLATAHWLVWVQYSAARISSLYRTPPTQTVPPPPSAVRHTDTESWISCLGRTIDLPGNGRDNAMRPSHSNQMRSSKVINATVMSEGQLVERWSLNRVTDSITSLTTFGKTALRKLFITLRCIFSDQDVKYWRFRVQALRLTLSYW